MTEQDKYIETFTSGFVTGVVVTTIVCVALILAYLLI